MTRPPAWGSVRCAGVVVLLFTMLALAASMGQATVPADAQAPVVAIADVHGDFDDFVDILNRTGLTDKQNHWIGGKSTFVQTGDLLDRGPKPRDVMDLMMALEKEAAQAGGRVVSLLGNHEMMNIMGDLRYVIPANYASFADGSSTDRQKASYAEYLEWRAKHAALLAERPQPMEMTEAEWMARHPLGFVEHRQAFSPKGKYGEWLRTHSAVAEVEGIIFLHGGIHPSLSSTKLDVINKKVREEIAAFDSLKQYLEKEKIILPFFNLQEMTAVLQAEVNAEIKSRVPTDPERRSRIQEFLKYAEWLSVRVDGPLWFRGYDTWSEEEGAPQVNKVLEAYKASHIAVGHTVQRTGRIRPRFGNKVFLIDTGMLSSYYPGGRPSALEICGGTRLIGVYLDGQMALSDSPSGSPRSEQSGGSLKNGTEVSGGTAASAAGENKICSVTEARQE